MLDNTFVEEYFRIENDIRTNPTQAYSDREGKLLLTYPPFGIGPSVYSDIIQEVLPITIDANMTPDNVNLIIDNIVLFSTNPLCQNFLPLKIVFDAKPEIEFSNVSFVPLTDYKVIVEPLIPIDTFQNHRYSEPVNFTTANFPTIGNPPRPVEFATIINTVNFVGGPDKNIDYCLCLVYLVEDTGPPVTIGVNALWRLEIDSRINSPEMLTINSFPTRTLTSIRQIFGRQGGCCILVETDTNYSIIDMVDFNLEIDLYDKTDAEILAVEFITDNEIIVQYKNISEDKTVVRVYEKITDDGVKRWIEITARFPSFTYPIGVGNFYTNRLALCYLGEGNLRMVDYEYQTRYNLQTSITILKDAQIPDDIGYIFASGRPSAFLDTELKIFYGGVSIAEPNLTVAVWNDTDVYFYYFRDYSDFSKYTVTQHTFKRPVIYDSKNFFLLKRYQNQVYFYDDDLIIFNLDTGNIFTYEVTNLKPNRIIERDIRCSHISREKLLFGCDNIFTDPLINAPYPPILCIFTNQRLDSLNTVYKLVYNYDERIFPYRLNGNSFIFSFKLSNSTPIKDMEIFKYVLDIRIRYTKQKMSVNGATLIADGVERRGVGRPLGSKNKTKEDEVVDEVEDDLVPTVEEVISKTTPEGIVEVSKETVKRVKPDGKKTDRFSKSNRSVGDVARVLGYVGEDFSVVDFLNLYTSS